MQIRKAKLEDAEAIHAAHMRSILELCQQDYNEEQLNAWGRRPYREDRVHSSIIENHLWVVEKDGKIEGFGELQKKSKDGEEFGYMLGLYLTSKVYGQGLGKKIVQLMEGAARDLKLAKIYLHSTITSLDFYKSQGYKPLGEQEEVLIGGVGIPCIHMCKNISANNG